ncbi:dihydropteroate synthase [Steroidobacter agaridevorans]|uniref:Dihydropteroate synthase n=1 Tax=Steroidobacter agaridevorans TaxID=2695856 RepID=A0A829YNF8_9GAMM|nr:dihydropteroate synthase [Steroidobacter agaridevorans]GFE84865.1 dihydropteroate synthase [Steroidobacter agaridevorans]GFE91854.1 dihydropteroate synthase [Steroidobacter agaridevorans]
MQLRCGRHTIDLSHPLVMGILNVTPDSFSDGGQFIDVSRAVEHALRMIEQGAGMIDVGGESTRPGAADVSEAEEIGRVVPVIEALVARTSIPISIDTSKAAVMSAAVAAGASLINDVRALREPGALEAAARTDAAVCLMHMQGQPRTMQHEPRYDDVVGEVRAFLEQRVEACLAAGIGRDRLVLDPGIGFGKRLEHNLALLAHLPELGRPGFDAGLPLLVGVSRKSMFQTLLGRPVEQRLAGGLAVATAAVLAGAAILRVHDVAETVDAVKVAQALRAAGYNARAPIEN